MRRLLLFIPALFLIAFAIWSCSQDSQSLLTSGENWQEPAALDLEVTNIGELHNEVLLAFAKYYSPAPPAAKLSVAVSQPLVQAINDVISAHQLGPSIDESVIEPYLALCCTMFEQGIADVSDHTFDVAALGDLLDSAGVGRRDAERCCALVSEFTSDDISTIQLQQDVIQKWRSANVGELARDPAGSLAVMLDVLQHSFTHWSSVEKRTPHAGAWIEAGDALGGIIGLVWGPLGSVIGAGTLSIAFRIAEDRYSGDW